jgi:hypothetical protein
VKVNSLFLLAGLAIAILLACVPASDVKAGNTITGIAEIPSFLAQINHYEAEDAMVPGSGTQTCRIATLIEDEAASGGKALHFATISPAPPGYVVLWGPYQPLPPGDYAALFRMRISDNDFAVPLAAVEVTEESEQQTNPKVIAKAELTGRSFPEAGRFFIFFQPFHVDKEARVELRILWYAKTELDVDYRAIAIKQD